MVKRILLGLMMMLGAYLPALAAEPNVVSDELVTSRLVAEGSAQPGESVRLALDMSIAKGWHTYWKNAGDSGQAVAIDWTLPEGVSIGDVQWPAPERQAYDPLMNYGYSDRSTLLMNMSLPADWPADKPVELGAGLFWLVCADVCIPGTGNLTLNVPTGDGAVDQSVQPIFAAAEAQQPTQSPYAAQFNIEEGNFQFHLEGDDFADKTIEDAYFFPAEWGVIAHAAPQKLAKTANGLQLATLISDETDDIYAGEKLEGVVELVRAGADGPVSVKLAVNADRGAVPQAVAASGAGAFGAGSFGAGAAGAAGVSFPVALIWAFLGGLILNLMPCVFPVLALKALSIAKTAHEGGRERVTHGLAYAAGVLVLFALLAGGLIALKGAGAAIGWGFQLQNPIFVAALAFLMLLVGLNLSGLFDVSTGLETVGSDAAASGGTRGAFFTGALAAIVATPCSAPFMASAIGAALAMSAPQTMAVFLMLGLGLAFPMILLGLIPGLARLFPKPGMWMVRLKEFLAFPMYITAAWLVWVLGSLAGQDAMFMAMVGGVLVAFAAWAITRVSGGSTRSRVIGYGAAAAAMLAVAFWGAGLSLRDAPAGASGVASKGPGEAFTAARLTELRSSGAPVFINMTADWCITCKVNERVALVGDDFEAALADNGITYLKGDWTAYDPEITSILEDFGRAGVPLYAIYPKDGKPELLPQILTPSMLLERLNAV